MSVQEFPTKHIFVADDNVQDRMLFQEVIEDLPSLVYLTMASGSDEAFKILNELDQLPDVVFVALNMSDKNGFECLRNEAQQETSVSSSYYLFNLNASRRS